MTNTTPRAQFVQPKAAASRVRIFLDFWNFQLGMNAIGGSDYRPDWTKLSTHILGRLSTLPGLVSQGAAPTFEEMRVYLSINPRSQKDIRLKRWATSFLDRLPGVFINVIERRRKGPPTCPSCYS